MAKRTMLKRMLWLQEKRARVELRELQSVAVAVEVVAVAVDVGAVVPRAAVKAVEKAAHAAHHLLQENKPRLLFLPQLTIEVPASQKSAGGSDTG
jgi:16S rRNA G527 N7-methylase RsmG